MKKWLKFITIVVIFIVFTLPVAANERADNYISEFEEILPEGYEELDFSDADISLVGADALLKIITDTLIGEATELGGFFLLLLGAVLLTHLATFCSSPLSETVGAAVALISSILILKSLLPPFLSAMNTVEETSSFFSLLIPIMTGITLSAGGVSTSAAQAVGMNFTVSIVSALASGAFISISAFSFSLGLIAALGDDSSASLARGVKSLVGWLIGILTTLFLGTLSLQTVITSAKDGAAMRAAKYAAQGIIPVVGGVVSGALSTLAGGLAYAKDITGGGAIAFILLSSLAPLCVMLLYRLALSFAISLADTIQGSAISRALLAFRFATDTVIVIYSLSLLTYILEIILFMKGGVGIL